MTRSNLSKLFLFCFTIFCYAGCSQSEAQRDFEDQALSPPAGIVTMDANGSAVDSAETDPDDWRIAPDFSGLFDITTPAFPNPVSFNSSFQIFINPHTDAINGLYIYAFQQPGDLGVINPLSESKPQTLRPGVQSIIISPQEFAQNGQVGTHSNLYRIILYDGRQRVITYGDVQVK